MEATRLSDLFQSISIWPTREVELATVAEKVRQLLGVPFVAVGLVGNGARTGWALENGEFVDRSASAEVLEELVRRQVRLARDRFAGFSGSASHLKPVQWDRSGMPCAADLGFSHFFIANISGERRASIDSGTAGDAADALEKRIDYGWMLVGASTHLSLLEEVMIVSIAQRLSSLAETAALEAGIELRNQFLSIASHELKTPLTSIYGVLQLQERMLRLKKSEAVEVAQDRQQSYLRMVIRQTQRLNELIDGLLDVSRIQNGRFMADPAETDVAVLLREAVAGRLTVIAQEAGVQLSVDAPEALRAWVDSVRMEEVVNNLVMNAIRFSPEGGMIWIRLSADGGVLKLVVRDQGPSVAPEDQDRIFRPFERAQRTARFGGLGLGLFISRQIAQLHGGNVVLAESIPGKGNTFEATFNQIGKGQMSEAG